MRLYCIIIFLSTLCFVLPNKNYNRLSQFAYKPLSQSSVINFQVAFYQSQPSFGIQWWVSDNLEISGMIYHNGYKSIQAYNNISLGYYNNNIKWFSSDSNLFEISLHKIKYDNSYSNWINCSYKSRYDYGNFILGYDLNYYFINQNENSFISLLINYNINRKIILKLKSDIENSNIFISFNLSIPL